VVQYLFVCMLGEGEEGGGVNATLCAQTRFVSAVKNEITCTRCCWRIRIHINKLVHQTR